MSVSNLMPKSGVQLLMILGASFLLTGVRPSLGEGLLIVGFVGWLIFYLLALGRQF